MKRCVMIVVLSLGCTAHALQKIKLKGKIERDMQQYLNEKVALIQKNGQLIVAVWRKNLPMVQKLIKQGANVNAELENGCDDVAGYPLWSWVLFSSRNQQDKQILDVLLTDAVDFVDDHRDGNGYSPFIAALILGYLDVAKFLYKKGADINAQDNQGLTALWHCVGKKDDEGVKFLIACPNIDLGVKKIDRNVKPEKQESLLEYAVTHDMPGIVDVLVWANVAKQYISQEEKKRMMCAKNGRIMQKLIISGARYRPALKQSSEMTLIVPRPIKVTEFIIPGLEESDEPEKLPLLEAPLTTSSDSSHDSIAEPCDDIDKAFTSING
jgi:hypothetical protein